MDPQLFAKRQSFVSQVTEAGKFTALSAAGIYGCGFLVVTFAQARLGIVEFATLRPRIISAGVAFIFLVTLPLFLSFQWFRLYGFSPAPVPVPGAPWPVPTDRHKALFDMLRVISFPPYAYAAALTFGGIIGATLTEHRSRFFLPFAAVVVDILLDRVCRRWFERWPDAVVGVTSISTIAVFAVGARYGDSHVFVMAVWFTLMPLLFWVLRNTSRNWRAVQVGAVFAELVSMLLIYSALIYPALRPEYGGGLPQPVVVFLAEKGPLGLPGTRIETKLLDEIDQGYYLQASTSDTAYFLPRAAVAAIQFVQVR